MSLLQVDIIRNRLGDGSPEFDRGLSVAGIITSTGLEASSIGIGSTEVVSSEFQLKNITSIDSVTLSTLETALEVSPNTFNSLYIGGGGISTFTGNVYVAGITTVNNDLYVTGTLFSGSSGASLSSLSIGSTQVISSSRELQNITSLDSVTTSTIENAIQNSPNNFNDIQIVGISTFSNGPVLIGSGSSTGTSLQRLQVTGGGYISGNVGIGTTISTSKLTIIGDALITGILTASNLVGISTYADKAGIATYSVNSGISTNVIGGIGSITNLTVSGVSTFNSANVTGQTQLGNLRVTGVSTFNGVVEFDNIVYAEQDLFVSDYFTADQVAIATLTSISNVNTKNFSRTLNIGNDLILFHLNEPSVFRRSNWIISDEYDLLLGTKSEGATNFYSALIGITTGNDIVPGNTANVFLGFGTDGTKLTTTGYGVSITGSLIASDYIGIGTTNPKTRLEISGALGFTNSNVAIGNSLTGAQITSGAVDNILIGQETGNTITTGDYNTIVGPYAAYGIGSNVSNNVIIGTEAAAEFTGTNDNVIIGRQSGFTADGSTSRSILIGYRAGYQQNGFSNITLGEDAGYSLSGNNNLIMGFGAGYSIIGDDNVVLGNTSGGSHTTGSGNVFLGSQSGVNQQSGSNNIAIGYNVDVPILTGSNQLAIGNDSNRWIVGNSSYNVGLGTTNPTSKLTVTGDASISGIVTATGGFISVGNTTPIQISLVGNQLTFTAVGIGSTTLTLS